MQISQELFAAISEVTGDGFCLCEMIVNEDGQPIDYIFLEVNDRFEEYTGLKDAKGRTALELVPDLEYHWIETYGRVGLGREKIRFENGSVPMGRWFDVYASPIEPYGRLTILFRDVTARKKAETEREHALDLSHRLLDELNHRVKNSLSVISSVVSLEARSVPLEAKGALERIRSRVIAVGELYAALSSSGSIETISTGPYLARVVGGLRTSMAADGRVKIKESLDDFVMTSRQAVAVGLIVNELVTNSLKHAFAPNSTGIVAIDFAKKGSDGHLQVSDNGSGHCGKTSEGGLGEKLVAAFVTDLGGRMEISSGSGGTTASVTFPVSEPSYRGEAESWLCGSSSTVGPKN